MPEKAIKIILAILFFICLAKMPYGYFQLVRFVTLIGLVILAYKASEQENRTIMIIYTSLAILFQPFFKVALGRYLWNIIDVFIALTLLISIFLPFSNKEHDGKT